MKIGNVTACVLLAAVTALAQSSSSGTAPTPPTPAQQAAQLVTQLTTLLDLTAAQQATATGLFTTEFTTLQTIQTSMQTAQTALQTAITSDSGIDSAASTIGTLTQQKVVAQATADADFYAQLTSDQQTKYTTLKLGGIGGPGPGPGGGPGGPPPGGPPASSGNSQVRS